MANSNFTQYIILEYLELHVLYAGDIGDFVSRKMDHKCWLEQLQIMQSLSVQWIVAECKKKLCTSVLSDDTPI